MKERVRPYVTIFRLRAHLETQYRGAALGGIATQIAFALVLIFLYEALYRSGGSSAVPFSQVVTYVWLQQAFFRALFSTDTTLQESIFSGAIAYDMCRPIDPYTYWYLRILAQKIVGCAMRAAPLLLLAVLMPQELRILPPASLAYLLLSIGSLVLGFFCITSIGGIQNAVTMRTLDMRGISNMIQMIFFFFSGNLLPLTLFPDRWQTIVRFQPFALALDMPIRLYTGAYSPAEIPLAFGIQAVWLILLTVWGRLMWRSNLKQITVQGG